MVPLMGTIIGKIEWRLESRSVKGLAPTGGLFLGKRGGKIMHDLIASKAPVTKVHELRKTPEGREMLRGMGRTKDVPKGGLGEFIAWDGEGITVNGVHYYVLMGNSKGKFCRTNFGRLRTFEIFNLMLETESEFP